jgi:hypothetical protein
VERVLRLRDRRPPVGGSRRLSDLLDHHWDAAEASLAYTGLDLRVLVSDPTCTPRRLLVLLDHLPPSSPLALSVGPEWWWGRDVHAQLLGELIDGLNVVATASALPAAALGAKPREIGNALQSVKPWTRPWEPPKSEKPKTFTEKVRRLMSLFGG